MLQEKIDVLPAGRLSIEKNGRWYKWFRTIKTDHSVTREYIPKSDQAAAEQLALKKYLEEELAAIDIQLHILCAFIESYPSSPDFRPFQEEGLKELLPPSLMEKEQKTERWMAESYEKSMEHPESLRIPTKTGIYVRSKSEGIIADALYENNIPFRYEQALTLGDLKIYPDFTILDPKNLNDIFVWEHFGMMDSPGYVSSAKLKLSTYLDAHFLPGQNLITTYESKNCPLDSNYVSFLISYYFS